MPDSIKVLGSGVPGAVNVKTWYDSTNEQHVPSYITWEHSLIHEGKVFYCSHLLGSGSELANGASLDILVQAASGMHIVFDVASGGNAEVYFFRSPIFSAAGTAMSCANKNEYSSNTTSATITHTPTITDDGTQLSSHFLPGGTRGSSTGGQNGTYNREIILKDGLAYMSRLTNTSGVSQPVSFSMEWYEL